MTRSPYEDPSAAGGFPRHLHIIPLAGLHAVAWTATAVSILLTIGRLVVRWRRLHRFGWEDILNAIAALLVIPFVTCCMLVLPIEYNAQLYFLGRIAEPPTREDLEFDAQLKLPTLLLFWAIIYLVKASFLILYGHIFDLSKRYRIIWYMVTAFTALSFGVTWLSCFWHCGSPSNVVDLDACSNVAYSSAVPILSLWCALNVLGGILLMAVPIVMITLRLVTLSTSQRLGLIFIFSIVLIDLAFDIVRTVYALSVPLSNGTNLSAVWTLLEPTIAVMVCAMPHYKSLVSGTGNNSYPSNSEPSFRQVKGLQNTAIPAEMELATPQSLHSRSLGRPAV